MKYTYDGITNWPRTNGDSILLSAGVSNGAHRSRARTTFHQPPKKIIRYSRYKCTQSAYYQPGCSPFEYAMIARLPPICGYVVCTFVCVRPYKRQKLLSIQFDVVYCGIFYIFMDIHKIFDSTELSHCSPCVTGKFDPVHAMIGGVAQRHGVLYHQAVCK